MIYFLILFVFNAFSCERPMPVHKKGQNWEACLESDRIYEIGHLRFINFPKANVDNNVWVDAIYYFSADETTTQKLCELFGAKRQEPRNHLTDKAQKNISYSRNGFRQSTKNTRTLKVLACSIL